MSSEGNKYALIVACDLYADPDLKQLQAPPKDARALQGILENPKIGGFRVESLINQPYWIVREKVNEFIQSCGREDSFLLYFSCHGIKDKDGHLYFATINTNRKLLYATGIESNFVNNMLNQCRAQKKVVLLDCCYSGAFGKEGEAGVRADKQVNTTEFFGRGSVIITASDSMQYSFEDDKIKSLRTGSYSTSALVEGLENGKADVNNDGKITYNELYDYVYDYVKRITPDQTPTLNTHGVQGDFVIFKNIEVNLASAKRKRAKTGAKTGAKKDVTTKTTRSYKPPNNELTQTREEWIKVGDQFYEKKMYQEAINCYDKALQIGPSSSFDFMKKGFALHFLNRYEEAIKCFDKAIEINPNDAEAWGRKGKASHNLTEYEEAIKCFDKAIEINPRDGRFWLNKSETLRKLGNKKYSKECSRRGKQLGSIFPI